jgi:DNA-3-methyladenine glycosylase I
MDHPQGVHRCRWVPAQPLYQAYHDQIWGVPVHDDQALFAKLSLDTFQAGLSWWIILKKQQAFEAAFHDFDPLRVAAMDERDVERLIHNESIVRNRKKIEATIHNARCFLSLQEQGHSFAELLWSFVGGVPLQTHLVDPTALPSQSAVSDAMSKQLKAWGFRFVGSTVCYAFMQAVGMVNDHETSCFRHKALCPDAD